MYWKILLVGILYFPATSLRDILLHKTDSGESLTKAFDPVRKLVTSSSL